MLRLPPGGTLSLQCTISRLNLPPKNLHWKHEKQILTSQTRPGVSLEFEKLSGESHTKLVIIDLKSSDEGTYQCTTDVSRPATVQVFIGKKIFHTLYKLLYILCIYFSELLYYMSNIKICEKNHISTFINNCKSKKNCTFHLLLLFLHTT